MNFLPLLCAKMQIYKQCSLSIRKVIGRCQTDIVAKTCTAAKALKPAKLGGLVGGIANILTQGIGHCTPLWGVAPPLYWQIVP